MKKQKEKIKKNEDGQALIMVILAIVVLMGIAALVVDVGILYVEKANMQKAADAAALAGAQDLPNVSAAEITAKNYAEANGVEKNEAIVTASYKGDSKKIKVTCTKTVPHFFGRILGFTETKVSASAVAMQSSGTFPAAFDYAVFSASTEKPLSIGKNNWTINGHVHSNNSLEIGKNNNILNGRAEGNKGVSWEGDKPKGVTIISDADIISKTDSMWVDFNNQLKAQIELASKKYNTDQIISGDINESIYVNGDVTLNNNKFNINGFVYATGDIILDGNGMKIGSPSNRVFIYSEKDIHIDGNNAEIYGIIYAPNGTIYAQKNNWILYGRLIADSFPDEVLKNNQTITASDNQDDFAGIPINLGPAKLIE